jgi:hypothetical protein
MPRNVHRTSCMLRAWCSKLSSPSPAFDHEHHVPQSLRRPLRQFASVYINTLSNSKAYRRPDNFPYDLNLFLSPRSIYHDPAGRSQPRYRKPLAPSSLHHELCVSRTDIYMQRILRRMHVRYLVKDLVRHWIDTLDILFDINGRSSTSFCLARSCFDVGGVSWCASKLLHQVMKHRRCCWCNPLWILALRQRPSSECRSITNTIRYLLRFDVGCSSLWYWG